MIQTIMDPKNLDIYLTNKKELGLNPQNCACGGNFNITAKILENHKLWKIMKVMKIIESSRGPDKNWSSSVIFWANELNFFIWIMRADILQI